MKDWWYCVVCVIYGNMPHALVCCVKMMFPNYIYVICVLRYVKYILSTLQAILFGEEICPRYIITKSLSVCHQSIDRWICRWSSVVSIYHYRFLVIHVQIHSFHHLMQYHSKLIVSGDELFLVVQNWTEYFHIHWLREWVSLYLTYTILHTYIHTYIVHYCTYIHTYIHPSRYWSQCCSRSCQQIRERRIHTSSVKRTRVC